MKNILWGILLIIGFSPLFGQECTSSLSGNIIDKNTDFPMVNAKISIVGTNLFTYSDFNGNYSFENLCNSTIKLQVTAENSQELITTVIIDGDTKKDFYVDHHPEELATVFIVGQSKIRKSITAQEQSISGKDIDNFSSSSLGDALKQMSGVSTLKTGKNIVKPVIQGLSGSRVPILNNGVRMEDQEWGADHAPNIDLNSAGKLTVIKGAAALQYGGDAIGGIVITDKPKIPKKDTLFGKTILSGATNGRGGAVTSSLIKSFQSGWYIGAQGTYKKFGDYDAPDYTLSNTGNNERDFSLNTGWKKHDYGFDLYYSKFNNHLGILSASSTGSVLDLVRAISNKKPIVQNAFTYKLKAPYQKVDHQLAKASGFYYFDGLGKLEASYSFQDNNRKEYDIRRGENKYRPSVDLNLKTHAWKAHLKIKPDNFYELNVGIDGNRMANSANPETGVQRIIPDYKSLSLGAYATGNYTFNSRWLVEGGFRYDYYRINAKKYYNKNEWTEHGYDKKFSDLIIGDFGSQFLVNPDLAYNNLSATAGLKYNFADNYDLRFNYAMSNRAPNPSELFSDGLHHSAASLEIGELDLSSEHSHKISASVEKTSENFTFNIAPYLNLIDNYIHAQPHGLEETVRGVFLKYQYEQQDVRLLGLDLDMNYRFNEAFSYHGKFSTVDGKTLHTHRALIDIPSTNTQHSITYQNQKWHNFSVSLDGDWVFRKKHYPNDNFDIKVLDDGVYQNELVDISTPPGGYFLTGLSAEMTFHPYQKGSMRVRLGADNLFNVRYRDYLNRLRYYADNTGRRFSLQLKFNY